jgi:hypothetical protein
VKTVRRADVEAFGFERLKIRDVTASLPAVSASIAHIDDKASSQPLTP